MSSSQSGRRKWLALLSVVTVVAVLIPLASRYCPEVSGWESVKKTRKVSGPPPGQLMAVSADGTHLVNSITNKPVFMTGDAPQTLIVQVDDADVVTYLADRAKRGFNVLWVLATDPVDQTN